MPVSVVFQEFRKEAAIYAGLKNAGGDYVATMDVDLQDPPGLLPEMYRILTQEDYDSVATRRSTRAGEPRLRSFLSESFYKFINSISKTEIVNGGKRLPPDEAQDGGRRAGNE